MKLNDNLKIIKQQLNEEKEKTQMTDELKKIYLNKQKEYEQYKVVYENKIKKYMEDNSKLLDQLNEMKYKNLDMEEEISRLKKLIELNDKKLENQIEEGYKKCKEIKEKIKNDKKDEPFSLIIEELDQSKITIERLKEEIKYYKNIVEILKKDNIKVKRYDELEEKNKILNDKIKLKLRLSWQIVFMKELLMK